LVSTEKGRQARAVRLVVGTRGSALSLAQTDSVIRGLAREHPEVEVTKRIITTRGDRDLITPLWMFRRKGVFEREIDLAVVRGEVDFAVVAVPERESPNDVLVSRRGEKLSELPRRATVGTSSPRRKAQLLRIRPDLKTIPIRGNVETRVSQIEGGSLDAVVLAEAGLSRLGMSNLISERLPLDSFAPAPGQGAMAVVTRRDDQRLKALLRSVDHAPSMAEVLSERSLTKRLGVGCRAALGAVARAEGDTLTLYGSILSPDGREEIHSSLRGPIDRPTELGRRVAGEIARQGGRKLISRWRSPVGGG
jgi:hydroxymethylbilane synthase